MRAVAPRFIACPSDLQDARIVVYGIPFEGRVNLRKGACGGPRDLRLASDSIETYSPALGRDLEDLPLADVGDCELPDGARSEEHTSELQSRELISYAVFCLKKKKKK